MPVVEDGTEYFLHAGDVFFLKHNVHHWGMTPFDSDTSWIYVHFKHDEPDASLPEISPDFFHRKHIDSTLEDYQKVITLPKLLHNMRKTSIEDKFRKLVELFGPGKPYLIAYVNPCLHELLMDIYMYALNSPNPESKDARVNRLISYLGKHIKEPFDSMAIEDYMELSYKYLGELFKSKTGITIHEYLTNMKIDRASRQLCETTRSITSISESLGYSDPLYFSTVFKKNTGMSPKTYREKFSSKL